MEVLYNDSSVLIQSYFCFHFSI